jgi:hypothetical protein
MKHWQNRGQRSGRGAFISVGENENEGSSSLGKSCSSEQILSEMAQYSANSIINENILRAQIAAADRINHIEAGIAPEHRQVLRKVQAVIEPDDSLNEIGRKAGVFPAQITRANDAAKRADKFQLFRKPKIRKRQMLTATYAPPVVPHERVMMTHQGATLSRIGLDDRSTAGFGGRPRPADLTSPRVLLSDANNEKRSQLNIVHASSHTSGCDHPNRQWLPAAFADFRLTCLSCKAELGQKNPFQQNP